MLGDYFDSTLHAIDFFDDHLLQVLRLFDQLFQIFSLSLRARILLYATSDSSFFRCRPVDSTLWLLVRRRQSDTSQSLVIVLRCVGMVRESSLAEIAALDEERGDLGL